MDSISSTDYSKTSFLVQIKFITEDLQQTQTQTLIINLIGKYIQQRIDATKRGLDIKD